MLAHEARTDTHHAVSDTGNALPDTRDGLLRFALKLDAVASGALGLLAAAAAPMLEGLLGVPTALLLPLGLALVAYAAAVWFTGSRPRVSRTAAWAIVGLNVLWTIDSLALALAGWLPLTGLGVAVMLGQAVAVGVFADLQFLGLRRARPAEGRIVAA